MTARTVSIRGLDTVLFRDGRPFDTTPGSVAGGLGVPFPSTLAGFIRTQAGRAAGSFDRARAIRVRGPLLCRNDTILFAAPADAVPQEGGDGLKFMRLRPFEPVEGAGCDIPGHMQPMHITDDLKAAPGYEWWPLPAMMTWLADGDPNLDEIDRHAGPSFDERVHVAIAKDSRTAEEGMLFTTRMVAFERHLDGEHVIYTYVVRLFEPPDAPVPDGPGLLGGEQRIGVVEAPGVEWPQCPAELAKKLKAAKHVRLILATPAIFDRGWEPGWIDRSSKEGSPPGLEGVTLKLVSAAVPRRHAVSGWEYGDKGPGQPKPFRWLAPAGSVYFFEIVAGDPALLADEGWLAPVSDLEPKNSGAQASSNNRDDGFGLALWGVWAPEDKKS